MNIQLVTLPAYVADLTLQVTSDWSMNKSYRVVNVIAIVVQGANDLAGSKMLRKKIVFTLYNKMNKRLLLQ
jgi:hypothetical protein